MRSSHNLEILMLDLQADWQSIAVVIEHWSHMRSRTDYTHVVYWDPVGDSFFILLQEILKYLGRQKSQQYSLRNVRYEHVSEIERLHRDLRVIGPSILDISQMIDEHLAGIVEGKL